MDTLKRYAEQFKAICQESIDFICKYFMTSLHESMNIRYIVLHISA